MNEIIYNVAQDFSAYPGGRFRRDGANSGQELRANLVELLNRARREDARLRVILDGTAGYGASFLEEAFGGLVRCENFTTNDLSRILSIEANASVFQPYKTLAERYIEEAQPLVAA